MNFRCEKCTYFDGFKTPEDDALFVIKCTYFGPSAVYDDKERELMDECNYFTLAAPVKDSE